MTAYSETVRFKLRKLLGTNKVSEVDTGFASLADDCDKTFVGYEEDTFAKRPAAGRPNAEFRATDTGLRYRDNGTTWEQILGPGIGNYTSKGFTKVEMEAGAVISTTRLAFITVGMTIQKIGGVNIVEGQSQYLVPAGQKVVGNAAGTIVYILL